MRPKFNHPMQKVLWYLPYYGSAIFAVFTIILYERQLISMAAMITIIAVALAIYAALLWWAYRTRRMQVESEIIDEALKRDPAGVKNDSETEQRVNIYDITIHNSSRKVILEVVTVFLLLAAWGILWTKGWENLFSTLVMTVTSVGALIAARFPFMMSDAEEHKDMSQIILAVKKQQIYALVFAVMAVVSPIIDIKWGLLELLVVFLIVEGLFFQKNKSEMSLDQQDKAVTGERFNSSDIHVERNVETIAFEVVTGFLILMALCITVLSYNVIMSDLMRYSMRVVIILGLASQAITQLVKAVKFAKADKDIKNIRQFRLAVRENRVYGIEFAIMSLILAISIRHHIIDPAIFIIVIVATTFGTYFIFRYFINKTEQS